MCGPLDRGHFKPLDHRINHHVVAAHLSDVSFEGHPHRALSVEVCGRDPIEKLLAQVIGRVEEHPHEFIVERLIGHQELDHEDRLLSRVTAPGAAMFVGLSERCCDFASIAVELAKLIQIIGLDTDSLELDSKYWVGLIAYLRKWHHWVIFPLKTNS